MTSDRESSVVAERLGSPGALRSAATVEVDLVPDAIGGPSISSAFGFAPAPEVSLDSLDLGPILPAMPVLAPPTRAAPRRPMALVEPDRPVSKSMAAQQQRAAKLAGQRNGASRRSRRARGRHRVRSCCTFLLLVGVLAGTGYAGWYKFIRRDVAWSADVAPSAAFVESTLHGTFETDVPVVTLDAAAYEARLGSDVLARLDPMDETSDLLAFRAVGLVTGVPTAAEVGRLVAPSLTSFYDGADGSIVRLDGTTAAFQLGLVRSLTLALVDQRVHYADAMGTLSPSQREGYWALINGLATDVIAAKQLAEPQLGAEAAMEIQARRAAAGVVDGGVPWYLSSVVGATETNAQPASPNPDARPLEALAAPPSDATVFDPATGATPPTVPVGSVGQPQGLQFWYQTLVPTFGVDAARAASLLWTGDSSTTSLVDGRACIQATIITNGPPSQAALFDVLTRWAASRPASSAATVALASDGSPSVVVSACEPSEGGPPPSGSVDDVANLFQQADSERATLDRVSGLNAAQAPVNPACVVAAYRNGAISDADLASSDPAEAVALSNVAAFCAG